MRTREWNAGSRTLIDVLRQRAAELPDLRLYTFLDDGEEEGEHLTCAGLESRARSLAARLQELGMRGERALLLFPPGLDFIVAFFGCLYAGAVAVPAYPPRLNRPQESLRGIVRDCRPRAVLAPSSLIARRADLERLNPELAGLA